MKIGYHPNNNPECQKEFRFSIIIPTWNNLEYLKLCIESIRKNSSYEHQIALHINEGTDGTLEWAKEKGLDFTYSSENIGICLACNSAYSLCKADYIVYLNDDMYVCPQWDFHLYDAIEKTEGINFYYSSTMIEWKETGNPCVIAPFNFGETPANFNENELLQRLPELEKVKPAWNGSMWPPSVMHRHMWDRIGGFSVEFSPGMYSDPDICMKLWMAGCRNFKGIGNSLVYHFMSKSTKKITRLNKGKKQFMTKWGLRAKFFKREFLRIGESYNGPLSDPSIKTLKNERLKVRLKGFIS